MTMIADLSSFFGNLWAVGLALCIGFGFGWVLCAKRNGKI